MLLVLLLIAAGIVLVILGALLKGVFYLLIIGAIVLALALIYGAVRTRLAGRGRRSRR